MVRSAFSPASAARLRALRWTGTFEAHLTVEATSDAQRAAFATLCETLGVKCVLIELARGVHRSQPMTSSHHAGELGVVVDEIEALYAKLMSSGFSVVRVKLEADVVDDMPELGDAHPKGTCSPDGSLAYFEFHAKLRVTAPERAPLNALCLAAGAHLSRNDHARDEIGATRFVTLRAHTGRAAAVASFDALVQQLTTAGHIVISTKAEYTIHDDRIELDAGWL